MDDTDTARQEPDATAELIRLKRSVFGLRDALARQAVELELLRRDVGAAYGLLRVLVDRSPRSVEP